ncbi:metal ABC transporter ATP-binding protein [Ochrobactrum cytisi]|nr:metal ABC transporter ATP-binding protein [Brucella cytisi]
MLEACLTFSDLTLGYNRDPAVHHLNGVVRKGSLTAVVGGNGSGKSTLMKGIAGLLRPMDGSCSVAAGSRLAYLPQQSELDRSFPARVIDLVSLGLWPRRGLRPSSAGRPAGRCQCAEGRRTGRFRKALDRHTLRGQMQRALFARVMVQDANLILLDEPFNAVDARTITDLPALIKSWHGESRTVMVVVHDLDLVREHFPEALLLAGRSVARGDVHQTLSAENLLRARHYHEARNENSPGFEPAGHIHDHHHHGHEHAAMSSIADRRIAGGVQS